MIVFFKMDYNQITMFAILKRESASLFHDRQNWQTITPDNNRARLLH